MAAPPPDASGSSDTSTQPPDSDGFDFAGKPGPLFKLVVKNALLSLITLGIYRFWARTNVRHYFWNHTRVGQDPMEYTGRGIELFIGMLIAIAILIVFAIATTLITLAAEIAFGQNGAVVTNLVIALAYLGLVPIALYRARRYRLTRSVYRGVRFGQDGSDLRYAALWVGHGLLMLLTLGFTYPYMRAALERYRISNSRFGDKNFTFSANGSGLFPMWLFTWFGIWIAFAITIFATVQASDTESAALPAIAMLLTGIGFIVAMTIYGSREFRYFTQETKLGGISFASDLKTSHILSYIAGFFGAFFLFYLAFIILAGLLLAAAALGGNLGEDGLNQMARDYAPFLILFILIVVVFFGIFADLANTFIRYFIYRHAADTAAITNLEEISSVVERAADMPSFGEGLADALDISGGI